MKSPNLDEKVYEYCWKMFFGSQRWMNVEKLYFTNFKVIAIVSLSQTSKEEALEKNCLR